MGFLDRMLGDLIQDSTGLPARRLVRAIGAKKILMVGGAMLAGGLASEKLGQGGQPWAGAGTPTTPGTTPAGTAPGAAPPPPPPPDAPRAAAPPATSTPAAPPAMAPPPPPPPPDAPAVVSPASPVDVHADAAAADDGPEVLDELSPELTYAIVRTMVAAALADGDFADAERQAIESRLDESNLSLEQLAQVRRDMSLAPSTSELAAMIDDPERREVLYRFAAAVTLADGDLSDLERGWLGRFGEALGLDAERRGALAAELAG